MKVLKTMLRAFILGIGVGVLVAPRAGSETRKLISDKLGGVMDSANDLASKLDHSSAEGGTSAAFVPKQHYADSTPTTRVVGTPYTLSM